MVLMHLLITVLFPIHLLLGLLLPTTTPVQLFQNLTMSIVCLSCSLKHVMQIWQLPHMLEIETALRQLDDCVQSEEEHHYYQNTLQRRVSRFTRCIYATYTFVYVLNVPIAILTLLAEPRELLYEAWLPFDWRRGGLHYYLAFGYQYLSMVAECCQGLTNDIYTPLTLCNVSAHIHLFGIRMSRLGYSKTPEGQTNQQLRLYFEDFKLLMR